MAVGTGIGFDLDALNSAISDAEKNFKKLTTTGVNTARAIDEAFKIAANGGLKQFRDGIAGLDAALKGKGADKAIKDIGTSAVDSANKITQLVESIRGGGERFTDLMARINDRGAYNPKNGALESVNTQLDEQRAKLKELKDLLNFYAKGEGLKAVDTAVHPKEYIEAKEREAEATMRLIEKLEQEKKERESLARLQRELAKRQGEIDANYEPRLLEYTQGHKHRMQMESTYAKYSSKLYEDTYNEQIRSYEQLWDKVEKSENSRDARIAKQKIAEYKAVMSEMMALDKVVYSSQKEGKANTAEYDAIEARHQKLVGKKLALETELDKKIEDLKEKSNVKIDAEKQKRTIQQSKEEVAEAKRVNEERLALYKSTLKEMKSLDKDIYRVDSRGTDAEKASIGKTRERYKELEELKTSLETKLGEKVTDIRKKFEAEVESETAKRLIRERELRDAESKRAANKAKADAKSRAAEDKRAENEKIATYRATLAELKSLDKDRYAIESKGKQVQEADKYQKILDRETELMQKKADLETQLGVKVSEIKRRFDNERLGEIAKRHIKEVELEEKAADNAAKASSEARRKRYQEYVTSYEGAMRTSQRAYTKGSFADEEQAIKNLEAARDRLKKSDADYATKLNDLNEAIQRHKESLKDATKTDKDRADEAAKNAKKIADAQAKYDSISRRERHKAYTTSYEGAIRTSDKAKTLAQEIQAVKNLEAARAKLNTTTADGKKKLDDINKRILQHNKNIQHATEGAKELEKAHSKLGSKIATVFSVQAIRGYINKMIQVRGEMELQQRSLQAILQNKDEANEIWQKTIDLAIKSPFRIKDLVTYTKQLAAYRVESDKLYETNKMLADVSAGLGVDMNRLILAFGQVKAANFLRGTELRQFTEAGIPMLDELAKHFNDMNNTALTSADVFDMISKRMVLFEDVEAVFERMTRAGGTFYRMQEIQSETLRGQISNLKDSLDIMFNNMGKDMDGILKGSVKSVKFLVDNYQTLVPILKALIASFALYKIQAFEASKVTLRFARAMKLQQISASGLSGMWTSLRVGFAQFYKGMVKTASMMASNPWLVGIAAFAALALEIRKVVKQFNEVDKAYNDMLNQQSQISAKVIKSLDNDNLDDARKSLQELIDLANKEYDLKINVDVKGLENYDDIRSQFDKIRQQMIDANAFAAEFQKELIEANLKTKWNFADWNLFGIFEQGLNKDIDQMGNAYDNLNSLMVNKLSVTIEVLDKKWKELTKEQQDAYWDLSEGIRSDEDLVDYFDRIRESYKLLLNSNAIEDEKLTRQLRRYNRRMKEAKEEFDVFINGIDETVMSKTDEEKTFFLNAAIDDAKAERNWSEFEETKIRKWLEEKYEIELTPKIVEDPDNLKAWQDSYNDLFRGKTGFREIRSLSISQKQVIEQLNAQYESTAELLERIQLAGEESVLEGGAYEGEDLNKLKQDLADIKEQLDWFGAQTKKDAKKESASIKILQKRISLLKEVNKKYLELEKTFDVATAKEKVMEAYSDTFREAFAGTGVDLDMYKVMTQVITDSKKVGEEIGSNLSEGVIAKLKELEEAGTYIRNITKELLPFTQTWEGFIPYAYYDQDEWVDGKPPKASESKTKKGTLTIGTGITNNSGIGYTFDEKATITEIENQELLAKIYEAKVKTFNEFLDLNKDLILTQEQYNMLMDQYYQGEAATKKAVNLAKGDWEQFEKYLNTIKGYKQLNKKHVIVNTDAIKQEWDALNTLQEKLALTMKWTNIVTSQSKKVNGKTVKEYFISSAMQNRSLARSANFSGDLDIANQLETVLVRIAGMDFTTTEGMVEALGELKKIAEKEGQEAKNVLSQAISGLEAEIGVRLKKESDKKLNDEVQGLFDQYQLTLDLKKLNLSRGTAEQLFNVKYLDLDGLRKAVQDKEAEFVGTEQQEEYKKFLEKIDEMERKSIVERTKTYAEYLTRGMNDRVKLKVEELRKLKELEESKEFNPDQKEQIRGQIKADTQKALDKESWEQFQATEWYTLMFTDLETLGTQAIKNLHEELSQLKSSLSHLDPSEVKEIVSQMEKLQEQLIERNPFESFAIAKQNLKALGQSEDDIISQLKAHEDNEAYAQRMLDMLAEIEVARADVNLGKLEGDTLALFQKLRAEVFAGNTDAFKNAKKEAEGLLEQAKRGKELTSEQLAIFANYRKSLQGVSNYWGEVNDKIQDIVGSAVDIMEVYGLSESSKVIAESVGSMSTLITQAVQFGIQMKAAGLAANTALGVIGWIAIAIQAIATVLTAIANYKNAKIDEQLEKQAKTIERQRDLYEQIEKKVESAYSVDQLRQYNNELERSVELEIQALEASIAMERSRKNADEDQIADWQKEIAEARERLAESKQEMMEELGGMFNITDFASGFVDAWWNAMDEGKSGLDALGEHFEETMKDMVKKQALYQGAQNIMKQVQDVINQDLANDYDIDDWQKIWDVAKKANVDLDAFLQGWYDMFGSLSDGANSGLSALQKGIQGVSEETAQVIEAYLNSIRGYVSEQVTHTRNIYRILYDAVHSDAAAIRVRMV